MKIIWTEEAEQDRSNILDYIAMNNPSAAAQMNILFGESASRLIDYPMMGKSGKIPGTRELLSHRSYRLVYQIEDDIVWILTLTHTARQWPPKCGLKNLKTTIHA